VRWLSALLFAIALASAVGAANDPDAQTVTPVAPAAEQQIQAVAPAGEQQVQVVDQSGVQQVTPGTSSPAGRVARGIGKAVVGVFAGVVSVGVMVASLMFI
jgi:hypothetical protein